MSSSPRSADVVVSSDNTLKLRIAVVRVNTKGASPFAEYGLQCMFKSPALSAADGILKWKLWRRYSDFKALDRDLRRELGWHMNSISFPPGKLFGKLNPEFLEERRVKLAQYLAEVLRIPNTTTFLKPRSSAALRAFLKYDEFAGDGHLAQGSSEASTPGVDTPTDGTPKPETPDKPSQQRKPGARRMSRASMRRNSQSTMLIADAPAGQVPSAAPAAPAPAATAPPPPAPTIGVPRAPPPPPPPPPPPASARAPPISADRGNLLAAIRKGAGLKKAETVDKSKPKL